MKEVKNKLSTSTAAEPQFRGVAWIILAFLVFSVGQKFLGCQEEEHRKK